MIAISMFPTKSKDKISHKLSYPIQAKAIFDALADVTQSDKLELDFSYSYEEKTAQKSRQLFPIISVDYNNWVAGRFSPESISPGQKWNIRIGPVNRAIVSRVKELIVTDVLPQIHKWLCARPDSEDERKSQRLSFFFDEASDAFTSREHL